MRFSKPEVEALLRRLIEVRVAWLVEKYGFKGCVAINLFGATQDVVASPDSGFSGRIAGAAALDMRTEQRENGSTYYLGAMHAGTHITHPDVTVLMIMIDLLLFLQKQNLANAIYLFGLSTLLSGLGLKHMRIRSHHDLAGTLVTPYSWEDHGGVLRLLPVYPSQCSLLQVTSTDVAFPPFCRSCPCDRHDLSLIFIHRHTPDIYIYIYMYTYIYQYIYIYSRRVLEFARL